jgi:hypothetical protein
MTNTIFHVTVATLVGAMAVFGVAIATAQSARIQSWNDLLKPYEAKTKPDVPIAPSAPTVHRTPPVTVIPPSVDIDTMQADRLDVARRADDVARRADEELRSIIEDLQSMAAGRITVPRDTQTKDAILTDYHRVMRDACQHLVGIQGYAAVRRCISHNAIR